MDPTPAYNCDGYEFLWSTPDWWGTLGMNTRFYQWFGKNFGNGTIPEMLGRWQIPEKHIIRSCTYRGSESVTTWPGLKHDCNSVLGCLAIVGVLAQIRGLAVSVQEKCVQLLRELCATCIKTKTVTIYPAIDLEVDDGGNTSLAPLKDLVTSREWSMLKVRFL